MIPRHVLITIVVLVAAVLGLGVYGWNIARRAQQPTPGAGDTRPLAPPVAGPTTPVVLFLASDADGALRKREVAIVLPAEPAKRATEILRALVAQYQEPASTHPLAAGADIDDVYLVDHRLAVVDVNAVFADSHRSGMLVEELTLASMAQTLAVNLPGVTRLKLLVNGKERATLAGHADLSEPYDAGNAARLVK